MIFADPPPPPKKVYSLYTRENVDIYGWPLNTLSQHVHHNGNTPIMKEVYPHTYRYVNSDITLHVYTVMLNDCFFMNTKNYIIAYQFRDRAWLLIDRDTNSKSYATTCYRALELQTRNVSEEWQILGLGYYQHQCLTTIAAIVLFSINSVVQPWITFIIIACFDISLFRSISNWCFYHN